MSRRPGWVWPRVARVLAWASAVGLIAGVGPLRANPHPAVPSLRVELQKQLGGQADAVLPLLEALEARHLPVGLLRQKLREGIAKRVPPERIGPVLVEMASSLLWLDQQWAPCAKTLGSDVRERLLGLGQTLLISGVDRAGLQSAIPMACRREDPAQAMETTADLFFYLSGRLKVDSEPAWELARLVLDRGETEGAVSRLVAVLQDIHRQHGPVAQAVATAQRRLQGGVPLRTVRNELRDQFLRR